MRRDLPSRRPEKLQAQTTMRDHDPSPTCAERFVETLSKPLSRRDVLDEEVRVARCTATALYTVYDISSQFHVQPACIKH